MSGTAYISNISQIALYVRHSLFNYNRLYVSGHSAGGHITALMLTTQWSDYSLSSFPFAGR